jgi:hypothetical protein
MDKKNDKKKYEKSEHLKSTSSMNIERHRWMEILKKQKKFFFIKNLLKFKNLVETY